MGVTPPPRPPPLAHVCSPPSLPAAAAEESESGWRGGKLSQCGGGSPFRFSAVRTAFSAAVRRSPPPLFRGGDPPSPFPFRTHVCVCTCVRFCPPPPRKKKKKELLALLAGSVRSNLRWPSPLLSLSLSPVAALSPPPPLFFCLYLRSVCCLFASIPPCPLLPSISPTVLFSQSLSSSRLTRHRKNPLYFLYFD